MFADDAYHFFCNSYVFVCSFREVCYLSECLFNYFVSLFNAVLLLTNKIGVLMQKPIGLISLLDEESNFPKSTDLTFASKLKQHLNANRCFKGERAGAFTVRHYAGEVCFTCPYAFQNILCLGRI